MAAGALWYFGYGSNMHRTIFLERRQMRPLATRRGSAEGWRLCFDLPVGRGERGVANIAPEAGARVWGVLYLLTAEDLDRLDRTEGVHRGYYRRVAVDVIDGAGERIAAVTYQSAFGVAGRKPSPRYMRLLLEGATQHTLPAEYLRFLERVELAHDERDPERQTI